MSRRDLIEQARGRLSAGLGLPAGLWLVCRFWGAIELLAESEGGVPPETVALHGLGLAEHAEHRDDVILSLTYPGAEWARACRVRELHEAGKLRHARRGEVPPPWEELDQHPLQPFVWVDCLRGVCWRTDELDGGRGEPLTEPSGAWACRRRERDPRGPMMPWIRAVDQPVVDWVLCALGWEQRRRAERGLPRLEWFTLHPDDARELVEALAAEVQTPGAWGDGRPCYVCGVRLNPYGLVPRRLEYGVAGISDAVTLGGEAPRGVVVSPPSPRS